MKQPKYQGLLALDRHLPYIRANVPGMPEETRPRADGLVWLDLPFGENSRPQRAHRSQGSRSRPCEFPLAGKPH